MVRETLYFNTDRTFFCKFYGIADQIGQNLPKPLWVTNGVMRDAVLYLYSYFQSLAMGSG
jgi:hypothetical protein